MPYVGNEPTFNFASVTKDLFSGDGSTVAFTLSKASTTNGVAVFVENVRQEPTIAYAVSGTTLTFTAAPVSSSGNNIYVLHHNAVASTANHPAAQDLTAVKGTFTCDVSIDGGVVVNESSADVEFRVESNGDANMLFVDGGNNRVGIGTGTPAEALEVKTSSSPAIQLNQGGDYQGIIRLAGNDLEIRSSSGQMEFYTGSADGDSSTERMRITDAGKVGIGTTPSTGFHVSLSAAGDHISTINNASSSAPYVLNLKTTAAATDDNSRTFIMCEDSSATRCLIYADGDIKNHDGTYGTISDERIKQDITDAKSQWDDIKGMTFKNFKKKDDVRQYGADKAPIHLGLIAQELEKVSPNLVDENEANVADIESSSEFGTLYENGDEIPENKQIGDVKERKTTVKGIKYSILYLKAVKALQEAMTRIETLEAKVKTLEDA